MLDIASVLTGLQVIVYPLVVEFHLDAAMVLWDLSWLHRFEPPYDKDAPASNPNSVPLSFPLLDPTCSPPFLILIIIVLP